MHLCGGTNVASSENSGLRMTGQSLDRSRQEPPGPEDYQFCWEYLYLASEIARGLAFHDQEYREHEKHLAVPTGEYIDDPVADAQARLDVLATIVSKGSAFISADRVAGAIGLNTTDGSEEEIRAIGRGIEEMFVAFMAWSRAIRGADVPSQFVPVYRALGDFADHPIREIRRFSVEWTCLAGDLVRAKRAGLPCENFSVTLKFDVGADTVARFSQALASAKK